VATRKWQGAVVKQAQSTSINVKKYPMNLPTQTSLTDNEEDDSRQFEEVFLCIPLPSALPV
jgi:hypothetical protein